MDDEKIKEENQEQSENGGEPFITNDMNGMGNIVSPQPPFDNGIWW